MKRRRTWSSIVAVVWVVIVTGCAPEVPSAREPEAVADPTLLAVDGDPARGDSATGSSRSSGAPMLPRVPGGSALSLLGSERRFERVPEVPPSAPPPAPPPVPSPPSPSARYGMNVDPANPKGNPTPAELKAAGVRWLRVEWKASLGHAFYDPLIRTHRAAGLKVLLLVDYASVPGKPASTASATDWDAYLTTYVQGLTALASRYGDGVDAWQLWNEPDLPAQAGYDPGMPAETFGKLLVAATKAVRATSSRPVITAGLASGDPDYLARARKAVGALPVDGVAVHPYGQRAPDNWPDATWGFGNLSQLLTRYLAFGKPLWLSEIGVVQTSPESFPADYLENVYRLIARSFDARVPVVFWFCWSDGMVAPFGVHRVDGTQKPAYHRYRALAGSW